MSVPLPNSVVNDIASSYQLKSVAPGEAEAESVADDPGQAESVM